MVLSSGYIVFILNLISRLGRNLKSESNIHKFGVIYSDTNYEKHENRRKLNQYYIMVFLMRRLIYILIILFLYKFSTLQQICNISLHLLTFIYDIILKPYSTGLIGLLIYFFDFIITLIFGSLPLYIFYINNADQIGRIHIYVLIVTIALYWSIIIGVNLKAVWGRVKEIREARRVRGELSLIDKYLGGYISRSALAKITGRRTDFRKRQIIRK